MSGHLYVEERPRDASRSLPWDIAHHLYARPVRGKVFVVAENPVSLMAAVSKQWYRLVRQVQRERSSTLDAKRILALTQKTVSMQRVRFTAKDPCEEPSAQVFFATAESLAGNPPRCATLYVTHAVEASAGELLTDRMLRHGLVVRYV